MTTPFDIYTVLQDNQEGGSASQAVSANNPLGTTNYNATVAAGNPPNATTSWTASIWAAAVLLLVGAPVDSNNLNNVLHWMAAENPTSNWFNRNNPLNTGVGTGGGDGTGSAATLAQGAIDTADTINQSNMAGIKASLMADAPLAMFAAAVGASPWARGKYVGTTGVPGSSIAGSSISPDVAAPASAGYVPQGGLLAGAFGDSETGAVGLGVAGSGVLSDVAGAVGSALSPLATLEGDLTSGAFWKRIGIGAGGIALMLVGLAIILSESKAGGEAVDVGKLAAVA